jgi:hypothetical protein
MPLVDHVWVEFDGDKARIEWSVSLDGKSCLGQISVTKTGKDGPAVYGEDL